VARLDIIGGVVPRKQRVRETGSGPEASRKQNSKLDYDRKTLQIALKVGHIVLLFNKSVQTGRSKTLNAQWIRPNLVLAVI